VDDDRLIELLRALPPAPDAWVSAAVEIPEAPPGEDDTAWDDDLDAAAPAAAEDDAWAFDDDDHAGADPGDGGAGDGLDDGQDLPDLPG
jgi:hypothetical protein